MTEPTAEQVDREMDAATVPILGVEFSSAPMLTLVQRQIATALARVRIEAHAAGRDKGLRYALFLAEEEIRVASTSRKKGMTQKELHYWDGRQEAAQRMEKMLADDRALRGRT